MRHIGHADSMLIKNAYSNHPQDKTNTILEEHVIIWGSRDNLVFYVDGGQAVEKQHTTEIREAAREKASVKCARSLDVLEDRIDNNLKVRKSHFTNVRSSLASSFYWSFDDRQAFVTHMAQSGYMIRFCEAEADVAIAADCEPNDVVISGGSDMLAYASITMLWRPVSKSLFLVYDLPNLLRDIGLSRAQFTTLAIVSSNDYNRNIFQLRTIPLLNLRELVCSYLTDPRVVSKNKQDETFQFSIRVFVNLQQTPKHAGTHPSTPIHSTYNDLRPNPRGPFSGCISLGHPIATGLSNHLYSQVPRSLSCPCRIPPQLPKKTIGMQLLLQRPRDTHHCQERGPQESPMLLVSATNEENPALSSTTHGKIHMEPHKASPESSADHNTSTPAKSDAPKKRSPSTSRPVPTNKDKFVKALAWHHPLVTLEVGALDTNIKLVLASEPNLQQEVKQCVQEAAQLAAKIKRGAQRLIGQFIETIGDPRNFEATDRRILDHICERIKPKDQDDSNEQEVDTTDLGDNGNIQWQFLQSFMCYLYSGNYPMRLGVGEVANDFIDRLEKLKLYEPPRKRIATKVVMPLTPNFLVKSVATQLAAGLKRIYRNGSFDLYDKLKTKRDKGGLAETVDFRIREKDSSIENFVRLNKLSGNSRKISPVSSSQQPFISFSERELVAFFFKKDSLTKKLRDIMGLEYAALADVDNWIATKEPGFLIKRFLADVDPQGLTSRQRGKMGYRAAIRLFRKGYILRGSVRTDGFRIHLMAFKIRELQMVRYRRVSEDRLPSRLTSTVGGVDYWLQEIRHIISTKEDPERLWPGTRPEAIKMLTLDAGQAYVIGAYAHLPFAAATTCPTDAPLSASLPGAVKPSPSQESAAARPTDASSSTPSTNIAGPGSFQDLDAARPADALSTSFQESTFVLPTETVPVTSLNLAVNQKAVYQPQFRFQRWLEGEKEAVPEGETKSIADIESALPPLRGDGSRVVKYTAELKGENRLLEFYNGDNNRYKRYQWDLRRARQEEYSAIANRLLSIVDGSIGRIKDKSDPVLIGVGLGQFDSRIRLSSLDSTFLLFFIQKARSLGYIVVGLNKFYTSKKCPICHEFVAQVTLRRLYCLECQVYHHRDVMAAHNMYNLARGYLEDQQRPLYLHPRAQDGSYPWLTPTTTSTSTSTSASTTNSPSTPRKRAASTSTQGQGQPSTSNRPSSKRKRTASASNEALQRRGKAAKEE
ncbi:hypothetical protein BGX29_006324 [Mortierella sp. GBA35]|nr:hypothetical protein BGX29_006324 [Mortierella sp. GBA35]